jgi:hypothetical protein
LKHDEATRLEIEGALGDASDFGLLGGDGLVYGLVGGMKYTVTSALKVRQTSSPDREARTRAITRQTYECGEVMRGLHSREGSEHRFTHFQLETVHLAAWLGVASARDSSGEGNTVGVAIDIPDPTTMQIPRLGSLTVAWSATSTFDQGHGEIRLVPSFEFTPLEPITSEVARLTFVRPVLLFLSFALGTPDRVAAFHGLEGEYRPRLTVPVELSLDSWAGPPPAMRSPWRGEHLIAFGEVANDLESVVAAWFDLYQEAEFSVLDFMAPTFAPFLYEEENFVRVVRAMESWHRQTVGGTFMDPTKFSELMDRLGAAAGPDQKFLLMRMQRANEPSLRNRLRHLVDAAGDPLQGDVASYSRFVSRVVDARNSLIHDGALGTAFTPHQLAAATYVLRSVMTAAILQRLGFAPVDVSAAIERSAVYRVVRASAQLLGARGGA